MNDILVRGMLNGEVSVFACDISDMAEEARVTHGLMPVATIILGRTMAAATMMAAMLKNKGDRMTLMINGGGPAGTVMAVGDADLNIKAYVANPGVNPPPTEKGGFDISGAVGKDGFITVARDAGLGEPYVGKVRMVSGEIGEDVANYLLISEQQPSIVYVNTWLETDMTVLNAGGLMIRPLPGCSEETLDEIERRIGKIANFALMLFQSGVEDVLGNIFQGMDLKLLDYAEPVYRCDCSKERLGQVVVSLGENEIEDMIEKDKGAEITCHFCNKKYDFTEDDLKTLLEYAKG